MRVVISEAPTRTRFLASKQHVAIHSFEQDRSQNTQLVALLDEVFMLAQRTSGFTSKHLGRADGGVALDV